MGKTLSFGKGKGNIAHNNRDFITHNVDAERVADNITIIRQPLREAYEQCYGSAIENYNAHQTRKDRLKTLDGYMDEIKRNQANRNGEKLFYEQVIGVGDMHDSGILSNPEEAEKCKSILLDYMDEWQARNPNLHVFNAVLHMDEATPHLHVDYIPVGLGYKQGLQARNSLTRAFENMGVESAKTKDDNGTIAWQKRERERITEIAREYGIEIDVLGIKRKDYTIDEYKAIVHDEKQALKQIKAPKVNRSRLPFGIAVEWNADKVDKALERKAQVREHANTFKQATKQAEQVLEHRKEGLEQIGQMQEQMQKDAAKFQDLQNRMPELEHQLQLCRQELQWQQGELHKLEVENNRLKDSLGAVKGIVEYLLIECKDELKQSICRVLSSGLTEMASIRSLPRLVVHEKAVQSYQRQLSRLHSTVQTKWDWTADKSNEWHDLIDRADKAGVTKDLPASLLENPRKRIRREEEQAHERQRQMNKALGLGKRKSDDLER